MESTDLPGVVLALGIVFWLAGGAKWVSEKTRQLKLDNGLREHKNREAGTGD